jgi:hypothetical protein
VTSDQPSIVVEYDVKELFEKVDAKLDKISEKLDGKADKAHVELIESRLSVLEAFRWKLAGASAVCGAVGALIVAAVIRLASGS